MNEELPDDVHTGALTAVSLRLAASDAPVMTCAQLYDVCIEDAAAHFSLMTATYEDIWRWAIAYGRHYGQREFGVGLRHSIDRALDVLQMAPPQHLLSESEMTPGATDAAFGTAEEADDDPT